MSSLKTISSVWLVFCCYCGGGDRGHSDALDGLATEDVTDSSNESLGEDQYHLGDTGDDAADVGVDTVADSEVLVDAYEPPLAGYWFGDEATAAFESDQGVWDCGVGAACSPGWVRRGLQCLRDTPTLIAPVEARSECSGHAYALNLDTDEFVCLSDRQRPLEGTFRASLDEPCFQPLLVPGRATWQKADQFAPPPRGAVIAVSPYVEDRIVVGTSVGAFLVEKGVPISLEVNGLPPDSTMGALISVAFDPFNDGALLVSQRLAPNDFQVAQYVELGLGVATGATTVVGPSYAQFHDPRVFAAPDIPDRFYLAGVAGTMNGGKPPRLAVSDDRGASWTTLLFRGDLLSASDDTIRNLAVVASEPLDALLVTSQAVLWWREDRGKQLVRLFDKAIVDSDLRCQPQTCSVVLALGDGTIARSVAVNADGSAMWEEVNLDPFLASSLRLLPDERIVVAGADRLDFDASDAGRVRVISIGLDSEQMVMASGLPSVAIRGMNPDSTVVMRTSLRGLAVASSGARTEIFVNAFLVPDGR